MSASSNDANRLAGWVATATALPLTVNRTHPKGPGHMGEDKLWYVRRMSRVGDSVKIRTRNAKSACFTSGAVDLILASLILKKPR